MLRAENLVRRYGNHIAVDSVSFALEPGVICGFVGPNGAGKTTTMKMLATLLAPSDGRAWIGDVELTADPTAARRLLGYMPDFFGVYDDLKVLEYLEFYADCHGVPLAGRSELFNDLLELVRLTEKKDAYVDSLSRGMKQRLCLARCLVHDPAVLLLDEPASGLDPLARVEMRDLLMELQRMGKTILISSHILAELSEMCSHVLMIDHGKLQHFGPVGQVLRTGGTRRISMRLSREEAPMAVAFVQNCVGVTRAIAMDAGRIEIEVAGAPDEATDLQQAGALLATLVQAGVPVADFHLETGRLEDVLRQVARSAQEAKGS